VSRGRRAAAAIGLAAIAGAAFALRAQSGDVVAAGGHVALPIGDAALHARRALWTAQHWPALLRSDPLLGFPDGTWIAVTPLHTWLVAALARAFGGDAAAIERVALWLPPLLGALATLPVFAAAARLAGPAAGLGAATLFALLPTPIREAVPGRIGPEATATLLGAAWLAAALHAAAPGVRGALPPIGVALARSGLLLAAPGSLAIVVIADGAQLVALARAGGARALRAHALGLVATAVVVALAVGLLGAPVETSWAALALSWTCVAALGALALIAAALAGGVAPREGRVFAPELVLALWTAGFAALALARGRPAEALAAPAAVSAAVVVCAAWNALARRPHAALGRVALATALGLAALPLAWLPIARARAAAETAVGGDPRLATRAGTLDRFAETVRAVTPDPGGFDDAGSAPSYGILAPPDVGPALLWRSHRAWSAAGPGVRFVVTADAPGASLRDLLRHLHRQDARAPDGEPRWEHFRLIAEGPVGGRSLADLERTPADAGAVPYQLFEVVPGALLEAPAAPGTPVVARLRLETPDGRRFPYRAVTIAEDDGVARLRVPYPSEAGETGSPAEQVRARGPWRVRIGDVLHEIAVAEQDVRAGATIVVGEGYALAAPPEDPPP
jgi:hypothetical protein